MNDVAMTTFRGEGVLLEYFPIGNGRYQFHVEGIGMNDDDRIPDGWPSPEAFLQEIILKPAGLRLSQAGAIVPAS